jgi:NADH-quinone oxidoreductase subunit H
MPSKLTDLLHGIFPNYLYVGGTYIHLPEVVPYVALAGIIGFILAIVPGLIWIERVVIALMQDRSGPNRVGPRGLLQTLADGVKLFFKEEIRPRSVDVRIYYLAPVIAMIPALAGGGTLPLQILHFRSITDGHVFTVPLSVGDVNIGLLYILALSSLQVYGVVLAGWASNNKYSLLGGLRASAQLISYELAMGLSLLCVVVLAGSLKLSDVVKAQDVLPLPGAPEIMRGGILSWYWVQSGFIPFVIYTIAMIAETNRAPFDLPEAESELIAGFHTEYSSMKFAMFFMGEYASMLTVCGLNAAMFWGGSLPPLNIAPLTLVPGFIWFILKVMMGILFYVWLRATLPRLRYDALMNLGWKRLLPVGLVWLFVMAGYSLVRYPNREGAAAAAVLPSNDIDVPPTDFHVHSGAPPIKSKPAAPARVVQPDQSGDTGSFNHRLPTTGLGSDVTSPPVRPLPLDTIETPKGGRPALPRSIAPMPITVPGAGDSAGDRTRLSSPDSGGSESRDNTSGQP